MLILSNMPRWIKMTGTVVGAAAVTAAGAVTVGTLLWNRTTRRSVKRLSSRALARAANGDKDRHLFFSREHAALPAPVARYFEFALRDRQSLIRSATVRQTGILRASADATSMPFSAVEHFTVRSPGFIWDARCRMAPPCLNPDSRQLHPWCGRKRGQAYGPNPFRPPK